METPDLFDRESLRVVIETRFQPEVGVRRLLIAGLLLESYAAENSKAPEHPGFVIKESREMKMKLSLEGALGYKEIPGYRFTFEIENNRTFRLFHDLHEVKKGFFLFLLY